MSDDEPRENDHDDSDGADDAAPEVPADEVAAAIVERFPGSVFVESHTQPVVYVDRSVFAEVATFLRDEQQFMMLADITAVDHLLDGDALRARRCRARSASRPSRTSCRTRATDASA